MTQEYMPSEGEVRRAYASYTTLNGVHAGSVVVHHCLSEGKVIEFNNWLAAHDAQIRAEALCFTESELVIAAKEFCEYVRHTEPCWTDTPESAMREALKVVSEHREEPGS